MGVLGAYTTRSLKRNRARSAATVVGIALSCALLLAVATTALSLWHYIVDVETDHNGAYNAKVLGVDEGDLSRASSVPGVERVVAVEREGYAEVNLSSLSVPYVCIEGVVGGADAMGEFAELVSLHLREGRLPESADEICLPASLVDAGLVDAQVGGTVVLQVGRRVRASDGADLSLVSTACTVKDSDAPETLDEELVDVAVRTFTVCGLYEDNVALSHAGNEGSDREAGAPALTVAAPADDGTDGTRGILQAWLGVDDPTSADRIARDAFGATSNVALNTYVNKLTGFSLGTGVYQTFVAAAVLVLGVVVVSSVMLIRNSFAISVSERTRQFGLLRSVGATHRQLQGAVLHEALVLAGLAVPIGLVVGYAGTAGVLWACRGLVASWMRGLIDVAAAGIELTVVFSLPVALLVVVLTFATTLLSAWGPSRRAGRMSAMEAIRQTADVRVPDGVRRSGGIARRLAGEEGALAAKSFRRAKKGRRATVASLVTGCVLVSTAMLMGAYMNVLFQSAGVNGGSPYDLRYHFYPSSISASGEGAVNPEEAARRLVGTQGVTRGAYVFDISGLSLADTSSEGEGAPASTTVLEFVPDEEYRSWLVEQGLDADALMDSDNPRAVVLNSFLGTDAEGRYTVVHPFFTDDFTLGLCCAVTPDSDLVNVTATEASALDGSYGDRQDVAGVRTGWHRLEVEVGALADEGPWWWSDAATNATVAFLPFSALDALDASLTSRALGQDGDGAALDDGAGQYIDLVWRIYLCADDPDVLETTLSAELEAMGLSSTRLINVTLSEQSQVALFQTAQAFVWAFATIVSLIAISSAFGAICTGMCLRRREFAVLRSVGMTRLGLTKMLAWECLLYGVRVLLWSVLAACVVSWLLLQAIGRSVGDAAFVFPWCSLAAAAGALVVVALTTAYAVRKVDAGASPVAALRTETA